MISPNIKCVRALSRLSAGAWLAITLSATPAFATSGAGEFCELTFAPAGDPRSSATAPSSIQGAWQETLARLGELKPMSLDLPNVREGLRRFWKDMRAMNPGFSKLELIRDSIQRGEISNEAALSYLGRLATWSAQQADQVMNQSREIDLSTRKQLESHRMLLKSIETLMKNLAPRVSQTGSTQQDRLQKSHSDQGGANSNAMPDDLSQLRQQLEATRRQEAQQKQSQQRAQEQASKQNQATPKNQTAAQSNQQSSSQAKNEANPSLLESLRNSGLFKSSHADKSPKANVKADQDKKAQEEQEKKTQNLLEQLLKKEEKTGSDKPHQTPDLNIKDDAVPQAVLKNLFIQTLRTYASSESLLNALKSFQSVASRMSGKGADLPTHYFNISSSLQSALEALSIRYTSLEDFSVQVSTGQGSSAKELLPMIHFLEKTLTALSKEIELAPAEIETLDSLRRAISSLQSKDRATEDEIVEQFLRQLPGPLSRAWVKEHYRSGDGINTDALLRDLNNGRLDAILALNNIKRSTMFRSFSRPYASKAWVRDGAKMPIADAEPALETAQDLSYMNNIFRDGPPKHDIERLASGDLMEKTYREQSPLRGTQQPKEKDLYILLYDMSHSMKDDGRYLFQAAAMASTVDMAMVRVAQGHRVRFIAMPFGSGILGETEINTPQDAAKFFNSMVQSPPLGNSATWLEAAIIAAFNKIKQAQETGDMSLSRAHILLFTDGESKIAVERLKKRKAELAKKTPLSFHVFSMIEGNDGLNALATDGLSPEQAALSTYQFFTKAQMTQMLSAPQHLLDLKSAAHARSVATEATLSIGAATDLSRSLLGLRSQTDIDLNSMDRDPEVRTILGALKRPGDGETPSRLAEAIRQTTELELGHVESRTQRRHMRLAYIKDFFTALAKDANGSITDLIGQLATQERERLLQWLDESVVRQ